MSTATTTIPVTIQPYALAHAEKIGLRDAMERMIDQMKAMTPELRRVIVTLEHSPYDPTREPQIAIDGVEAADARLAGDLGLLFAFRAWLIDTFPPEVMMQFICAIYPGDVDGR